MFYSRASEALILFIRLSLAGSVAFETYPSKPTVRGIIKKCGIIKWFSHLVDLSVVITRRLQINQRLYFLFQLKDLVYAHFEVFRDLHG